VKISELRDWATATFGEHSHKEGQVLAALGPLDEWLGHLAKQGVNFELVPVSDLTAATMPQGPLHPTDEPPAATNSGGVGIAPEGVEVPLPDLSGFVSETNPPEVLPAAPAPSAPSTEESPS
jgi:hypothetical protein